MDTLTLTEAAALAGTIDRYLAGDARLTVFETSDNGQPVFDGSFHLDGVAYHIKPVAVYANTRLPHDPAPHPDTDSPMVVYRSSDYLTSAGQADNPLIASTNVTPSAPPPSGNGTHCGAQTHPENYERALAAVDSHLEAGPWGPEFLPVSPAAPLWRRGLFSGPTPQEVIQQRRAATLSSACPVNKRVAYFGVAADCTYLSVYQTPDKVRAQILSNWNQASAVYERQFNVMLGVIDMRIMDAGCPTKPDAQVAWNRGCDQGYSIESRLSDFSYWRGQLSKSNDSAALWHLMTNCASGSEVGIAWLGTLCQTTAQTSSTGGDGTYVSGTAVSAVSREEWQIVAHEIGHNFGAAHDCDDSTCPCAAGSNCSCCPCTDKCSCDANYIMNPTNPVKTNDFSPCSATSICATIASSGSCLADPGAKPILGTAMCGNGIREDGEECDCGTADTCAKDRCCDGSTCKLKSGAACSASNALCCDGATCQVRPANVTCRAKYSECDVAEVCDGLRPECPADERIPDGTSCTLSPNGTANGSGVATSQLHDLQCASGQCTSRDAQCIARGGALNITQRCTLNIGVDPCDLQCNSPRDALGCIFMSGSFLDGTTCGFHARCARGVCTGENGFYTFLLLFQKNLAVAVPVTILVGLVALLLLYTMIRWLFCGGRPRNHQQVTQGGGGRWTWFAGHKTPPPSGIHTPTGVPVAGGYRNLDGDTGYPVHHVPYRPGPPPQPTVMSSYDGHTYPLQDMRR
ncbi:hypothetical protein IWQ60_008998 [Tieghemiomyces parasiticus]|uniref:Disintegrin and metalloproteinase domain-containing protein B n=1 Tax=Tieghemiomyces parasiticus TaxID=78921 RepID=A0A9W8DQE9_9FUNG|nr:hypothetical protein IWQ60_008998 [Tieghemiomyces parasiticus]